MILALIELLYILAYIHCSASVGFEWLLWCGRSCWIHHVSLQAELQCLVSSVLYTVILQHKESLTQILNFYYQQAWWWQGVEESHCYNVFIMHSPDVRLVEIWEWLRRASFLWNVFKRFISRQIDAETPEWDDMKKRVRYWGQYWLFPFWTNVSAREKYHCFPSNKE